MNRFTPSQAAQYIASRGDLTGDDVRLLYSANDDTITDTGHRIVGYLGVAVLCVVASLIISGVLQ